MCFHIQSIVLSLYGASYWQATMEATSNTHLVSVCLFVVLLNVTYLTVDARKHSGHDQGRCEILIENN